MKEIVLTITETGREHLKTTAEPFNHIVEYFSTKEELKKYLVERYGKMPQGRKKIYQEPKMKEQKPVVVGFLHSFWNQDISHNSHKWYQTDWICFWEQETTKTFFTLNTK